jgi:hypothetical protein
LNSSMQLMIHIDCFLFHVHSSIFSV